jgi:hypothetical protein
MEATASSEMLVPICQATQHHIPDDCNLDTAMRTSNLTLYVNASIFRFIPVLTFKTTWHRIPEHHNLVTNTITNNVALIL